jgi:hypothetical protein
LLIGGFMSVLVGVSAAIVGRVFVLEPESRNSAWVTLGVGAGLTGLGIGLFRAGPTRIQSGTSIQWTPDGAPPAESDTAGKRQVLRLGPTGLTYAFK